MASGKSSKLIQHVKQLVKIEPAISVSSYRPSVDMRTKKGLITSRDGSSLTETKTLFSSSDIGVCTDAIIAIDEVHFFDFCVFNLLLRIVKVPSCLLVAAGLERDFRGRPIGNIKAMVRYLRLLKVDHEIRILKSMCHVCGSPAIFSQRLVDDVSVFYIGGDDSYSPVCACHFV